MEIYLKSIDPEKNRFRFYSMAVQPDLFGQYYLIRTWGRIGSRGRCMPEIFNTYDEAIKSIDAIVKVRHNHGYH